MYGGSQVQGSGYSLRVRAASLNLRREQEQPKCVDTIAELSEAGTLS